MYGKKKLGECCWGRERDRFKFRMKFKLKLGSELREGEAGREGEGREVKGRIKRVRAGEWVG